jgi:crotonobetainyl-CoA:carnitine CoA-transferase CaiB-like acyl-CoA transferase
MVRKEDGGDGRRRPVSARVLDLSGAIGSYCSKLLADLGADVLIVEPPWGDGLRRKPPFTRQAGNRPAESILFASYHANKRGITLDYTRPEALPLLEALGREQDVILVSPSEHHPLAGFDKDTPRLCWARPEAIVASITPFGLTGPLRDFRMTPFLSYAMSGGMHRVGDPDGPPLAFPGQLAWDEAGIHAALGIIAALEARDRVGGQLLDLSVHEVGAAKDFLIERYDVAPLDEWGRNVGVGIPPTGVWQCADGPLAIAVHQEHHWQAFLAMLDHPEALSDPAYSDPLFRREVFDLMADLIAPLMASRGRLELFKKGQESGLPCAPYNTPGDFVADTQPDERGTFRTLGGEGEPPMRIPWRWCHSSRPLLALTRPAPRLGEHNEEVYLRALGFGEGDLARWMGVGLV